MDNEGGPEGLQARPWTLKGVPEEARSAAIAQAERDRAPIGKWVARAILEQIKRDREEPKALARRGQIVSAAPEDVREAIGLLRELRDATGEPPPASVTRAAWAAVKGRLVGPAMILLAVGLSACVGPAVVILKNPTTGEVKQCGDPRGISAISDSLAARDCAVGYQAAGWQRMN